MSSEAPPGEAPPRVLVVEDEQLLAEALALTLRAHTPYDIVGVATTLQDADALIERHAPDVIVTDQMLPDGFATQRFDAWREQVPGTLLVLMTAFSSSEVMRDAREAGAAAVVVKGGSLQTLVEAIRRVLAGETWFEPHVDVQLGRRDTAALSSRERQILSLVAAGYSVDDIASRLFLSPHTVRNHIRNVLNALGAHTKLEAVQIATRAGLIHPHEPEVGATEG
ncbi:MAG TPA: response regulator transcription factor [Nitriliruptorales bacterium]